MEAETFKPNRTKGKGGGRKVQRPFFFVPGEGVMYPSESRKMTNAVPQKAEGQRPSWSWALDHLEKNDNLWLVIPLAEAVTHETQAREAVTVRATIWRTGSARQGKPLASQWYDGALWIRLYSE